MCIRDRLPPEPRSDQERQYRQLPGADLPPVDGAGCEAGKGGLAPRRGRRPGPPNLLGRGPGQDEVP
eukprot:10162620-Alexandrium_andersonii.AAC.1